MALIALVLKNEFNSSTYVVALQQAGFEVATFTEPQAFLQQDCRAFQCIVTSFVYLTPPFNGWLSQLRKQSMGLFLPVVVFHAPAEQPPSVLDEQSGPVDFLPLDLSSADLVVWVRSCAHWQQRMCRFLQAVRQIDPLTGLAYWREFRSQVQQALPQCMETKGRWVLLRCEIEVLAWEDGLEVLQGLPMAVLPKLGQYLKTTFAGEHHSQTNLGFGHFLLWFHAQDMQTAYAAAEALQSTLTELIQAVDSETRLSSRINIGLAFWEPGFTFERLLQQATQQCRDALDLGGGRIQMAAAPTASELDPEARQYWTGVIKHALVDGRASLAFQPIASMATEDLERYEVLLRVESDVKTPVTTVEFITMAERVGLSGYVDRWVLQNALLTLVKYREKQPNSAFFVKICGASLSESDFFSWLKTTLEQFSPAAKSVVLQVSEVDVISYPSLVKQLILLMHEYDLQVAMEHFGARSDAVRLLRALQPDYVKLDRSLTMGLQYQPQQQEELRRILHAAQTQGVTTMAAYVEDASGLALLWQARVDLLQGHFLAHPESFPQYNITV